MLKLLRRMSRTEWIQAVISLGFIVVQVWLDLKLPDYMSEITTLSQTEGSAMSDIWIAGGKMLLCALGSLASSIAVGFFAARIAASFSRSLRSSLFSKVDSFSMKEGDVIESGNHKELLAEGGFYANLYNSQFEKEAS